MTPVSLVTKKTNFVEKDWKIIRGSPLTDKKKRVIETAQKEPINDGEKWGKKGVRDHVYNLDIRLRREKTNGETGASRETTCPSWGTPINLTNWGKGGRGQKGSNLLAGGGGG